MNEGEKKLTVEARLKMVEDKLKVMSDEDKLKLMYPSVVTLIVQSEATTWARLQTFLVASGFACTAYAASHDRAVLCGLAIGGALLSVLYGFLMYRSRTYVTDYVKYGVQIELALCLGVPEQKVAGETMPVREGVLTEQGPYSKTPNARRKNTLSAEILAPLVPTLFAFLFVFLVLLTIPAFRTCVGFKMLQTPPAAASPH